MVLVNVKGIGEGPPVSRKGLGGQNHKEVLTWRRLKTKTKSKLKTKCGR